MRLGEYVKQYREQHDLSMRDFAKMADLSHQYVACLEKGVNNNGQPLSPTMTTYSTMHRVYIKLAAIGEQRSKKKMTEAFQPKKAKHRYKLLKGGLKPKEKNDTKNDTDVKNARK